MKIFHKNGFYFVLIRTQVVVACSTPSAKINNIQHTPAPAQTVIQQNRTFQHPVPLVFPPPPPFQHPFSLYFSNVCSFVLLLLLRHREEFKVGNKGLRLRFQATHHARLLSLNILV